MIRSPTLLPEGGHENSPECSEAKLWDAMQKRRPAPEGAARVPPSDPIHIHTIVLGGICRLQKDLPQSDTFRTENEGFTQSGANLPSLSVPAPPFAFDNRLRGQLSQPLLAATAQLKHGQPKDQQHQAPPEVCVD